MKLQIAFAAWLTAFSALGAGQSFNVLVFSKTLMYRHASITNGIAAIKKLGVENNFIVDATEDSAQFAQSNLAKYEVIVFLSTSGDVLNEEQQVAFQNWLRGGRGFVGVHAAVAGKVATEGTWPWYTKLFCTEFHNHPAIAKATIHVEDQHHPSTAHLPSQWVRTDEWYNFETSPRGKVHVLASVDEATYKGGTMGKDHPIAWWQQFEGGRVWYTALGHTAASYSESLFLQHLLGGIQFAAALNATDQSLFEPGLDLKNVLVQDATVSSVASGLRIATGHKTAWPGVTLPAPEGFWDLSGFAHVALNVKNASKSKVMVSCRVDNPGADGTNHCVTRSVTLEAGQPGVLRVPLKQTHEDRLEGKLFGMRGYPVAPGGPGTVDARNVTQLLVFVTKPDQDHLFEVSDIRATGTYTAPTAWVTDAAPFFPCIDTFGQYKHKDWAGKTRSVADLKARREAEASELANSAGPEGWNNFGGWTRGPQLNATGYFRVEKHRGKWWLVDPEGRLFWSHGIDCVRSFDTTPVVERESWFENFPGDETEFSEFFSRGYALKGHYAGRTVKTFSFSGANLPRKYGPDWKTVYPDVIHRRLRSWGLNTIANWSDEATRLMRRTPYTDAVSSRGAKNIEGSEGYWGKFPDVFDMSFADGLRRSMAAKKDKSANDPWCIGYFSDNEMSWGDELSLAVAALKSSPEQAAKKVFLADLEAKYGDIAKLNNAWGTTHISWDALLQCREAPDKAIARDDLAAFYNKTAEAYFCTVRDAIKAGAPNQLYLGCRFAWVNDRAAIAAAKYCDVVSYNLYRRSVADFKYPGGDKPLINGEFHFGALDRGMFHTGLVPVENQAARAQAYKDYVFGAVRHPQFVGTHWFQYKDQPTTGRVYDEENYQIGLVDIADTPYPETIAASREVASVIYETRLAQ